jgi:hypothetical protein
MCVFCLVMQRAWAGNPSFSVAPAISSSENPYQIIIEKNAFHLNPVPVPPPYEPPNPKLPEIKISGFVVNSGHVRALFACIPKSPKEPELYYSLAEGERDGILQLVKIHLDEQTADIINSGVPMRLTMQENGFQLPAAKNPDHLAGAAQRQIPTPPAIPQMRGYTVPHG